MPADREPWRDKRQRERTRRVMGWALERGELPVRLVPVLETMLELSDAECGVIWHSLASIGRHAGGAMSRTVGGWLAELRELGWVERQHQFVVVEGGRVRGTSNLWRIDIPEHLRVELAEAESRKSADTRRRRRQEKKGRVTPSDVRARQGPRKRSAQGPAPPVFSAPEADELAATDAAIQKVVRTGRPDDPDKRAAAPILADEIRAQFPTIRRDGRSPP